ncbi:unnamed protein product [Protopolystoma xenopodis]|uniref:Uncharacterized protein n=1 Tax=Protopolystoma xenopodis TaxID=117903 RepID=A0A448WZ74_9PLAT|nr:unnamed protein product [Protopolystoma xenopodis]
MPPNYMISTSPKFSVFFERISSCSPSTSTLAMSTITVASNTESSAQLCAATSLSSSGSCFSQAPHRALQASSGDNMTAGLRDPISGSGMTESSKIEPECIYKPKRVWVKGNDSRLVSILEICL